MVLATESRLSVARVRRRALDAAALVRLPNLFTAPPDVVAGAALATAVGAPVDPVVVGGLALASVLLYAAGTTLNDVADVAEDARDRPGRPIPSGAIGRRTAAALGLAFLVSGVAVATLSGAVSGATAVALAVTIGLYDLALKGGPAGPAAMGVARGLNLLLGLSAAGTVVLDAVVWAVPAVLAGYVASLTWLAEAETGEGDRRRVVVTAAAAVLVAVVVTTAVRSLAGGLAAALAALVAVGFVVWVGRPLIRAYGTPVPETVGPAVGTAVLGIVLADAAVAAVYGPLGTAVAVAFLVPAVGLAGRFEVT